MKSTSGFTALHVPYKGSGPGLTDLMIGNVQPFFDGIPSALPQMRTGKVKGIGVASSGRTPELPTLADGGLKGFAADNCFGITAPARMPRGIVLKLNADIVKALDSEEVKSIIARQGGEVMGSTPEGMAEQIRGDREKRERWWCSRERRSSDRACAAFPEGLLGPSNAVRWQPGALATALACTSLPDADQGLASAPLHRGRCSPAARLPVNHVVPFGGCRTRDRTASLNLTRRSVSHSA